VGRRRTSKSPDNTPPLCQRFEWVLQHFFGDSITGMASALGVSHTALSRVTNHGQLPSATMIEGLARLGQVNLDWLLGVDESSTQGRATQNYVVVCDHLLVVPPSTCPEVFTALGLPTASPFHLHDPYWYRVPEDSPLVAEETEKLAAGDYLLIESGPAWTRRAKAYLDRLFVLRDPRRPEGVLARVAGEAYYSAVPQYSLNTFGTIPSAGLFTAVSRKGTDAYTAAGGSVYGVGRAFYGDDVVGVILENRSLSGRASHRLGQRQSGSSGSSGSVPDSKGPAPH
jgi:transcriptional regulator with XRE-family HTH domain